MGAFGSRFEHLWRRVLVVVLVALALLTVLDAGLGWWLSWLAFVSWLSCAVITVIKGKWRIALIDVFLWLLSYFAAARLAKPGSLWARRFYDSKQMHRAHFRYGGPSSGSEFEGIYP